MSTHSRQGLSSDLPLHFGQLLAFSSWRALAAEPSRDEGDFFIPVPCLEFSRDDVELTARNAAFWRSESTIYLSSGEFLYESCWVPALTTFVEVKRPPLPRAAPSSEPSKLGSTICSLRSALYPTASSETRSMWVLWATVACLPRRDLLSESSMLAERSLVSEFFLETSFTLKSSLALSSCKLSFKYASMKWYFLATYLVYILWTFYTTGSRSGRLIAAASFAFSEIFSSALLTKSRRLLGAAFLDDSFLAVFLLLSRLLLFLLWLSLCLEVDGGV